MKTITVIVSAFALVNWAVPHTFSQILEPDQPLSRYHAYQCQAPDSFNVVKFEFTAGSCNRPIAASIFSEKVCHGTVKITSSDGSAQLDQEVVIAYDSHHDSHAFLSRADVYHHYVTHEYNLTTYGKITHHISRHYDQGGLGDELNEVLNPDDYLPHQSAYWPHHRALKTNTTITWVKNQESIPCTSVLPNLD